jgi:hypothetical protein
MKVKEMLAVACARLEFLANANARSQKLFGGKKI